MFSFPPNILSFTFKCVYFYVIWSSYIYIETYTSALSSQKEKWCYFWINTYVMKYNRNFYPRLKIEEGCKIGMNIYERSAQWTFLWWIFVLFNLCTQETWYKWIRCTLQYSLIILYIVLLRVLNALLMLNQ